MNFPIMYSHIIYDINWIENVIIHIKNIIYTM